MKAHISFLSSFVKKVGISFIAALLFSGCSLLPVKKAGLQVLTTDVSSSVFVDGQYVDKTPYIGKEFKPGTYTVKIQPDNPKLVPHETTVKLEPGLLTVITWNPGEKPETSGGVIYELEKLPSKKQTELSIFSLPDAAIVSIDQQQKEFTPISLPAIDPGNHEIEITLPSYQTQKHTISTVQGHRLKITVKLAKEAPKTTKTTEQVPQPPSIPNPESATQSAVPISTKSAVPVRQPVLGVATTSAQVTIEPTGFFVDGKEVLKVRSEPTSTGSELGYAPVGSTYPYLDESKNGWLKISFNQAVGWVSGQYSKKNP